MLKDSKAWIINWEQIIIKEKEKKFIFVIKCLDWYFNFMNAVKLVLSNWMGIFNET